ncbi:MAG: ion transporter [Bacteroidetes bacterium]|nr:ion transporter [Bacteroidota bacterium]MBT4399496.1 ion transporter [Bacteroidota bacterium]MBT4411426.1 ion transporter [Bacteroidota bacterium]MBT5426330.1 ion transporter [Bacteroidota bacterium]MBT7091992.1 ion transporter [Bacteroidota bacterium]
MRIKPIIEDRNTRAGRLFDWSIQILIVISLICFSVETLPDITPAWHQIMRIAEIVIVVIFTLEYILRLIVSDRKVRFIFSFYGLVDLAAIIPFYLSTGIDLRSIRTFRFLRLFRAFKMMRYSKAIIRFQKALKMVKEEMIMFMVLTVILLFLSGVGIFFFEHKAQPEVFKSIFDSIWWAIESLTTVGYGDIYPITVGGRIFTFFVLMIGLGIIAVPTGLIASALSRVRDQED